MKTSDVAGDKLVPLLQELIRNQCVNDGTPESGNETRSAETLRRFFSDYGIKAELLGPLPSRQSLLVRIPGADPMAPSLMFMGHMDVVPAAGEDWSVDPFTAEIRNGEVWGRGAIDMLNMTSSMAVAIAERAKEGGKLPGDLLFLAVADEEASGRLGARWLVEHQWEKVKADYMVAELGGFHLDTDSGRALTITLGEKGVCWVRLSFRGESGHGSTPYRSSNAIIKLARAVDRIAHHRPKITLTPLFGHMVDGLVRGRGSRFLARRGWGVDRVIRNIYRERPGEAKFLDSASRMTISPGMVEGGSKINIIADRAEVLLDIRIMPAQTVEMVQAELLQALGDLAGEVHIEFMEFFPSNTTEVGTALEQATARIAEEHFPGTRLVPMLIGGVTDGRYWRQRGTRVCGFSLFDKEMTTSRFASMIHGVDERVSISSLEKSLDYFYRIPEEFFSLHPLM